MNEEGYCERLFLVSFKLFTQREFQTTDHGIYKKIMNLPTVTSILYGATSQTQ
jgi:hypothetical protein